MGIKRVLVGLTAVVLVTSAVVACGFRGTGPWRGYGPCGPHWRGEDPAQRRAYVVERVSQELSLNVGQRAKLEVLADQMEAQRQALWGEGPCSSTARKWWRLWRASMTVWMPGSSGSCARS